MIHCSELTKTFRRNGSEVVSLDRVSLEIGAGEFVVVRGPSGSGKTTLLLSIGGMQQPSAGTVTLDGENLYAMSSAGRARARAEKVGFVFQMFHLVPHLGKYFAGRSRLAKRGGTHPGERVARAVRLGQARHASAG